MSGKSATRKVAMPAPAPRKQGRPRDESRERAILTHTLNILGEHGYAGLTVDEVVARAKVSKATIYRRWATKEELVIAAFDCLPQIEIEDRGDLVEEILDHVEQYNEFLHTTPLHSVLPALVSEAAHNENLSERLVATVEKRREPGLDIIRRAVKRGELPRNTDINMAYELFIGPLMHRSFFYPENIRRKDFQRMVELIAFGLKKFKG